MIGASLRQVTPAALPAQCRAFVADGGRMQTAYAWFPGGGNAPQVRYLGDRAPREPFVMWSTQPARDGTLPSLAQIAPLLAWHEREMMELCGVEVTGHPEPHHRVLHAPLRGTTPPLAPPGYRYPDAIFARSAAETAGLPQLDNDDVQLLPFGPIRADVFESAQFLFQYAGERILHYQPRLFFKHRGMEKRFEGRQAMAGVLLAERISGVDSVAHALAFAQAVESASGCAVPARARWLRLIAAELERVYNHLNYLGHLCHTTTLKVGEAQGKLLAEEAKQLNARVSGSRFLRGIVAPGGVRRDLVLDGVDTALRRLAERVGDYARRLLRTDSHLDRLLGTGVLAAQLAFDMGATGPVERASGLDRDLRRDHPYGAYVDLPPSVAARTEGDADARMRVRIAEIEASLELVARAIAVCPDGPLCAEFALRPGSEGLGWVEGVRGTLIHAVHVGDDGTLARVKIESPSFANWRVFPYTVHDSNMMDYAINEASFGLTIAGCDR